MRKQCFRKAKKKFKFAISGFGGKAKMRNDKEPYFRIDGFQHIQ